MEKGFHYRLESFCVEARRCRLFRCSLTGKARQDHVIHAVKHPGKKMFWLSFSLLSLTYSCGNDFTALY